MKRTEHSESRTPVALVSFALSDERVGVCIPGFETVVIQTGVGKTNASSILTEALLRYRPAMVLNVGSAGTLVMHPGDVLPATKFVDSDLEHLRFEGLETEIDNDSIFVQLPPAIIAGQAEHRSFTVSTGDSFVTEVADRGSFHGDAIDMEAFAEAAVCRRWGVPFLAVKYITDVVGQNSVALWSERLADMRRHLSDYFSRHEVRQALAGALH